MADLIFKAGFLDDGDAATGLTVTVNVYRITLSNAAVSQTVTAGAATEIGDGMYLYQLASADLSLYNYVAAFNTVGTADQSVTWCEGLVVPDELISSRSTVTTAQVNTEVDNALDDYDAPTKAELDSGLAAIPAAVAAKFASVGVVPINEDGATLEDLLDEMPSTILLADWEAITGTVPDRSTLNALRFLRNKWTASGGALTVYKEDDATTAWEALLTTNSSADRITGSTPE